jgi:myo-inositol-1(or 4)-monophosphatase
VSSKHNLRAYLDFATRVAYEAGRLTLGYFQRSIDTTWKADDTPVTVADRAAEAFIREQITARFPDHAIVGEEFGSSGDASATHRWFIDPIDGTKSFICGVPLYSVLIGLEINGRVEVGVANFPALNELIAAASGQGCWWNGRTAHVSMQADLSRSIVAHIDTASFERVSAAKGAAWTRLQKASYYNAGWCDAYGYLLVATGRVDVMLDPIMNVHDCAPFPVILREAGGFFGDWQGNETIYAGEALATNATLLPEVVALLAAP